MSYVLHTPVGLEYVDLICCTSGENLIDVLDNGLNVGRAVLRHKLADNVEIPPEIANMWVSASGLIYYATMMFTQ